MTAFQMLGYKKIKTHYNIKIMYEFVLVISSIFAILQILLLFKLWAMTDNVKKITQKIENKDVETELNKLMLLDKREEALKKYEEYFLIPNLIVNYKRIMLEHPSVEFQKKHWESYIDGANGRYEKFAEANGLKPNIDIEKFKQLDFMKNHIIR